ncbi:MAG: hypothetical protein ACOCXX_00380 [Planctomycetota bacterium]
MKAGFAERDITPAVGMERPGGYSKRFVERTHDPLKVRAAVFDDGAGVAALVGVDTCIIGRATVELARAEIDRLSDVPGGSVMIGASHTHTGGPLFGFLAERFDDAPKLIRGLAVEHSVVVDPEYHRHVARQIASAVIEAYNTRETVRLSVGAGFEDAAVFNRRFVMTDGRTVTHPGKGNPEIVEAAGPIDPQVGVIAAWRGDDSLLGCVVNYACHGTTAPGNATSADWIGYMDSTIRGVMGPRVVTVFLNGACGDITQVDNRTTTEREFGYAYSRLVGTRVGAEAVKVMVTAPKGRCHPVRVKSKMLKLDRRRPDPASLARCRKTVTLDPSTRDDETEWTFAKERLIADWLAETEPTVEVEVQAVQVGPAVLVANPSEFFCSLGLDIRHRSTFPHTFVVELANGGCGYVPDREAFGERGGGYETVLTSYSNLETEAGPKIVDASVALSEKLKPGRVPGRKKVSFSGTPWGYGVLGPELD